MPIRSSAPRSGRATTSSSGTSRTAVRARRSTPALGRAAGLGRRATSRAPGSPRSSAPASPTRTGCVRRSGPSRTGSSRRRRWTASSSHGSSTRPTSGSRRRDLELGVHALRAAAMAVGVVSGSGEVPARLTIVPNEVAADLVCSFLRTQGILLQPPRHEHGCRRLGRGPERRRAAGDPRRPDDLDALARRSLAELASSRMRSRALQVRLGADGGVSDVVALGRGLLVMPAELLPHRGEHLVREQALVA